MIKQVNFLQVQSLKIRVPHRPAHIDLFLLLAFLCYQAHQWVRHFFGAALCGGFGSMTFTVATTRQPCSPEIIVTLSGPLLTYGLAWLGMFLLRTRRYSVFAYALIFASFAHLRFIQTLTGMGDELVLAQQWFGVTNQAAVAAIVFLIGLPPVIAAWRSIANERRLPVFIGSWLLPIFVLFVQLFGDKFLFEVSDLGTRLGSFLGIWLIVLMVDLLASALFVLYAPRYLLPREAG